MKLNTPLKATEIDFRIQSINKVGFATILAYKDARVDMNRLDAVYGVGFWQKKYELINGNLFCSVGIYNKELQQWIWLQDVGTESFTEKEKGQASDAFKRACFNLGIGRELYDYPLIQVKLNSDEFKVLRIKNPKLWWPNNLGDPNLYTLKLQLEIGGIISDIEEIRFGIREVEDYLNSEGHKGFKINGKELLIKGAGWVDDLMLNDSDEKVISQVEYARHMNLNCIRLEGFWGG